MKNFLIDIISIMQKSENKQEQEPPLRSLMRFSIKLLATFFIVLLKRLAFYLMSITRVFVILGGFIARRSLLTKKFIVRMLTYRGGVFYETPRLGLAALLTTTASAMFIVPVVTPLAKSYSLTALAGTDNSMATVSEFSAGVLTAPPSLSTTSSGKSIRKEIDTYVIQPGDTLSTIAANFLVSIDGLKYVNDLDSDILTPGDELKIPPVDGLFHIVEDGDTLAAIAKKYNVPEQAIADFNSLEAPFVLHGGQELIIPNATVPKPEPVYVPPTLAQNTTPNTGLQLESRSDVANVGTGQFVMPTNGVITQYFWWGHQAIDIANRACGANPIFAADAGTIVYAQWWPGGGGYSIWIDHGNGYMTQYAHMSKFAVKVGDVVGRGQVIGYMGSTGRSTGCHVHFVVKKNGIPINPLSVL